MTHERETFNAIDSTPLTYGEEWKEKKKIQFSFGAQEGGFCMHVINAVCVGVFGIHSNKSIVHCYLKCMFHKVFNDCNEHWTSNSQLQMIKGQYRVDYASCMQPPEQWLEQQI